MLTCWIYPYLYWVNQSSYTCFLIHYCKKPYISSASLYLEELLKILSPCLISFYLTILSSYIIANKNLNYINYFISLGNF